MSGSRIFFCGLLGKADVNVFSSKFQIKMSLAIFLILPHPWSASPGQRRVCVCVNGSEDGKVCMDTYMAVGKNGELV